MIKASHIFLRAEITRDDALRMADWLTDPEVTCYLHEDARTAAGIREAAGRACLPVVTHLFNQNGRFFMICPRGDSPVGFLRLQKRAEETELVIVIGEKRFWGRGIGGAALQKALPLAFYGLRSECVVAHIHPENLRSLKLFLGHGFMTEESRPACVRLHLPRRRYLGPARA